MVRSSLLSDHLLSQEIDFCHFGACFWLIFRWLLMFSRWIGFLLGAERWNNVEKRRSPTGRGFIAQNEMIWSPSVFRVFREFWMFSRQNLQLFLYFKFIQWLYPVSIKSRRKILENTKIQRKDLHRTLISCLPLNRKCYIAIFPKILENLWNFEKKD